MPMDRDLAGTDSAVIFDSVELARGGAPLFDALSVSLRERRIGLIGANGAGKSSFLRLINGLILPDGGHVRVHGRDTVSQRKNLPTIAGFVFQNADHQMLFPTVGEEIAFGLINTGMTKGAARARVAALLKQHGCDGWESRAVHELSEGQKQLVCILSAIAPEPRVLLLDECFASLDLRTRTHLAERLAALPQQIVMASHDLDLLADFDRLLWIDAGRIRADGAPNEIIAQYRADALGQPQLIKRASLS